MTAQLGFSTALPSHQNESSGASGERERPRNLSRRRRRGVYSPPPRGPPRPPPPNPPRPRGAPPRNILSSICVYGDAASRFVLFRLAQGRGSARTVVAPQVEPIIPVFFWLRFAGWSRSFSVHKTESERELGNFSNGWRDPLLWD